MTEPQVWTLIGVFAAGLFGMLTLMSTMFVRVVRTEIGSVRTEIGSVRTEIRSGFDGVHQRIDRLDNDVNALMKHTFGIQRD
ncbi:hypothetical protein JF550_00880 [Microbacterium esteraromaticum]|uniref:DUF2746 domain-containing protein n=1 Tax=Microbacterium esteraromaticum TaxID=57043 RepID=A0A939DST6_9MICO|nr:hypothetical protein [Microbacterium esteraromaticum]MBN8204506.1 hypothetical protein [Microbacterium esteraromaticum]MBN8414660.1 hypothetical protein [Microbacterium esteraromaticum]